MVVMLLLTVAAGSLWWIWLQGVPVPVVDAPERLQCASYAPFRKAGQSPFEPGIVIPPAQIEADLTVLARHVDCVRTYSVDQGLDQVPRIAHKLGLKVLLGIWIGRDAAQNEREMRRALALIQDQSEAIMAVIVGNEVLLRGELPPEKLAAHISRVRQATSLPVSYADVWEFWLRNAQLAEVTSFVTIHILPYWEDDPVPIDGAIDHVIAVYRRVAVAMPGHTLYIGETGWPSAGRNRHGAQPGRIEQARFVRGIALAAEQQSLRYNVIEAFDQPWKRLLEGTVGGSWGFYAGDLKLKFPFRGAVEADPDWYRGWIAAAVGAAGFVLVGVGRRYRLMGLLALALAGTASGALLFAQFRYAAAASRSLMEWAVIGLYIVFAAVCAVMVADMLACWLAGRARPATPTTIRDAITMHPSAALRGCPRARPLGALRFAFLFGAAVVALLLVCNPRYRDFPLALYLLPFGSLSLLRISQPAMVAGREERIVASLLLLATPFVLFREGLNNPDAFVWSLLMLVGAGLVLIRAGKQSKDEADG